MRSLAFALVAWVLAAATAALDPIEVSGNKFFNKDGSQFFLKGVAYQLTAEEPDDPLIDNDQCQRDAALMKELGVNSLRVYHVDTNANHDACMKTFADAGIYLLIDLDDFESYICPVADDCLGSSHWNETQFGLYAEVMDTFHVYDNVLGFFIGNERITTQEDSLTVPYYKAATRDMKAYRDAKGYRKIPIGYSAAHIVQLQPMLQNYLTCGGNSSEIVDFYGVNSYSWCKEQDNMVTSAYDRLQSYAEDFPVPIFFSETGCQTNPPRLFGDQDAIFSDPMVGTWSGSIIYEWIQESNDYGLISYGPPAPSDAPNEENVADGFTRKGTPTPISPDFSNLKTKWASITPTGVSKKDYDPNTVVTPECPSSTEGGWWQVDGNVKLPVLGEEVVGTYSKIPSATADPSDTGKSNSGNGGQDGGDADDADDDSAASSDKQITLVGSVIAATVLTIALVL